MWQMLRTMYIWFALIVHNILALRREQNHVRNRTSAHLKEKISWFCYISLKTYGPVTKFLQKLSPETLPWVRTKHTKLGVFSCFPKYSIIVAVISQLVKKLQQWFLYEVIEDILPFVLNTKRPLSDIW